MLFRSETALFAEPLSCVINGANKLDLKAGEDVVVLGAGPIGLLYTALLKSMGARRIIVAEVSGFRAEKAREMGADLVVNPKEDNLLDVVMAETGIGAAAVVDAVGSLVNDAMSLCRRGGRVVLFGMNSNAKCNFQQFGVTRHELRIIGTFIANHTFPATIDVLESGKLPLEKLITHRLKLEEIPKGIDIMKSGEAIEIVVTP